MSLAPRLLSLIAVLALPASASAADQTVSPGDNVQQKVDAANAGETVTFTPGLYSVTVKVADDNVTLKGQPGAFVVNPSDATAPTIDYTGDGGKLHDLGVLSTKGTAVQFSGGGAAEVLRSTIASTANNGTALSTVAPGSETASRTLTVDSSVLVGKTALLAQSSAANPAALPVPLPAITTRVAARHVTAIGNLTVTKSNPAADAAMTVSDSIVRGAVSEGVTAPADRNSVAANASDAPSLFVNAARFNYHLRADAPVIDKGRISEGESGTDIDGQPRTAGSASDYGADEFHNRAPVARLAAPAGAVRQGRDATFSADGSSDPEAASGGGIATYNWNFGDGTTAQTTTPTASHAFGARQAYTVTLTVTDKQGATSDPVTVAVTAIDGTAPTVTIAQPSAKQRIALYRKGTRKRKRVTFFGTAADDTALSSVALALRPVASRNGTCRWFNGKRRLKSAPCTQPTVVTATVTNGQWRYTLPRGAKIPRGPYTLLAVAVDASGLVGAPSTATFRFR